MEYSRHKLMAVKIETPVAVANLMCIYIYIYIYVCMYS